MPEQYACTRLAQSLRCRGNHCATLLFWFVPNKCNCHARSAAVRRQSFNKQRKSIKPRCRVLFEPPLPPSPARGAFNPSNQIDAPGNSTSLPRLLCGLAYEYLGCDQWPVAAVQWRRDCEMADAGSVYRGRRAAPPTKQSRLFPPPPSNLTVLLHVVLRTR